MNTATARLLVFMALAAPPGAIAGTDPPGFEITDPALSLSGRPGAIATAYLDGDIFADAIVGDADAATMVGLTGSVTGTLAVSARGPAALAQPATRLAAGDVDADGLVDVAAIGAATRKLTIAIGLGTGAFRAATMSPIDVTGSPTAVAIGDIGRGTEIIVGLADGRVVAIGAQTPTPRVIWAGVGKAITDVAVGDANGDGRPDLVVASELAAQIAVLPGTGTPDLGTPITVATPAPRFVRIGRFDGSLVPGFVAVSATRTVARFTRADSGVFGAGHDIATLAAPPRSFDLVDLNGDDLAEAIVGTDAGIAIAEQTSNGFRLIGAPPAPTGAVATGVADVDSDGRPDLVATAPSARQVVVLRNTTRGLPGARPGEATLAPDDTAVVSGLVDPAGSTTRYYLEYGPTTGYGAKARGGLVDGNGFDRVSMTTRPLAPDTTYHYRVVAESSNGVTYSADRTIRTAVRAPVVTGQPRLSGTAYVGRTLTCIHGHWTGATTYEYTWITRRGVVVGHGKALVVRRRLRGRLVACRVDALGGGGRTTARSPFLLVRLKCVVPRLAGRTVRRATVMLRAAGCRRGEVRHVVSSRPAGRVVATIPGAGRRRMPGFAVRLLVSAG